VPTASSSRIRPRVPARAWIAALAAAALVTVAAPPVAVAAPQPRYEAPRNPLPLSPSDAAAIAGFQGSPVDRALELQYELAGDVGIRDAPFVGTHNSYNSVAEMGQTISTSDANQEIPIVDQLELQIRSLELDLHWFRRPTTGRFEPVVCHAFPNHVPCSTEKALGPVLDEINGWLRARGNRDQVLFIYLEDHLDNQAGYDNAASIVRAKLGDLLYAPGDGGCRRLPLDLTRDRMLKQDKRVILVGNSSCGVGAAWPSLVFDWQERLETRIGSFSDFPMCGPDFTRDQYNATQVRYYEDGRPSERREPRITPQTASQMAHCGVDLLGLDQLVPGDTRLAALVWSWARGEPDKGGRCSLQRSKGGSPDTRWKTVGCGRELLPACRKGDRWLLGDDRTSRKGARAECRARDARFAVPRTGFEAQLLRSAMLADGAGKARLGYVKRGGDWAALDERRP
jgi:hypothetical protein